MSDGFSCALIGEGPVLVRCAEILIAAGHEVVGAFSADARTAHALAQLGIAVHSPERDIDGALSALPHDYLFSIVNPKILSARAIESARRGAINYHDSPLPKYAGLNATTWALLAGETKHAVTWHAITPGIDDGDILAQSVVPIEDGDTVFTLNARCAEAAVAAFEKLVDDLAHDRVVTRPQDRAQRSYFGRRERPAGGAFIRPSRPAGESDRVIRALAFGSTHNPLTSPKLLWGGEVALVAGSQRCASSGAAPGTIVRVADGRLQIATLDGDLWVGPLTTQSGRALTNDELAERAARHARIDEPAAGTYDRITEINAGIGRHEDAWSQVVRTLAPPTLTWAAVVARDPVVEHVEEPVAPDLAAALTLDRGANALAAIASVLSQLGGDAAFDIAWSDAQNPAAGVDLDVFARFVPVRVCAGGDVPLALLRDDAREALEQARARGTYALDMFARVPDLRPLAEDPPLPIAIAYETGGIHAPGSVLTIQILASERRWRWSFDASRIENAQVRALIAAVSRVLAGLPVLDDAEHTTVVTRFNSAPAQPVDETPLFARFSQQAERTPSAIAVDDGSVRLTFAELDRRSNQLAHYLVRRGVRREQRVGVWTTRSATWVTMMLAIAKAGGVYCPLEPQDPAARAQSILEDARAVLLVTAGVAFDRGAIALETVDLGNPEVVEQIGREPDGPLDIPFDPQQLAYVIYTSGTTGKPNGVAVEHRQLAAFVAEHARFVGLSSADRVSQMASPAFDASISEVWPALVSGASLYPVPDALRMSLPDLAQWIAGLSITVTGMPTHLAQESLDFNWRGRSPRIITTGGSSLRGRPTESTPFVLVNAYGPTETTVYVTTEIVERGADKTVTIGRPIGGSQAYVLGPAMQPVAIGMFGELWIGGANVSRGYLENPALTARKFVPNPFGPGRLYRTGDRARWRTDGRIEFGGRIDDQVKLRGFRIELGEIEAALASVEGVREAAVVVDEPRPGEQRLIAYIAMTVAQPVASEVFKEVVRARVPAYMVPNAFVVLDALPRTSGGKLDRRALPEPTSTKTTVVAPRTAQEEAVAAIWRNVFHLDELDIHADFHDLGGHSLLAMKIVRAVGEELGVEISLIDVLESSTIAKLTEWIEQIREQPADAEARVSYVASDARIARATTSQEYFYYLDRDDHDPSSYFSARVFELQGVLDVDALVRSFREVAAYHSIYRTAYRENDGVLEQVVRPLRDVKPIELSVAEHTLAPGESIDSVVGKTRAELVARDYDLSTGEDLLRARLVRLAPDLHILVELFHHIVADAAGAVAFEKQLFEGYERLRSGQATALGNQPLQYIDYAVARERWNDNPARQVERDFWRDYVRNAKGAVIEGDMPRAAIDARRDAAPRGITADLSHPAEWRMLPAPVYERIVTAARDHRTTAYSVFMGALTYLLKERSAQDDIPVQTTYTRRAEDPALETINGCLTGWTMTRVDLTGVSRVADSVPRARDAIANTLPHGAPHDYYGMVPHPLRRVVFNYLPVAAQTTSESAPADRLRITSLAAAVPVWKRTWDLHLTLIDKGTSASLLWTGNSDLFRRETVVALLDRWLALLAEV